MDKAVSRAILVFTRMDKISQSRRSANMRAIKSTNTKPEIKVRKLIHSLGYRYRLHKKDLPGKPDLVFAGRRSVIFVHGCFWHMHGCSTVRLPKSNESYWWPKLERNQQRDAETVAALIALGWKVLTVWDCETLDSVALENKIRDFLGPIAKA